MYALCLIVVLTTAGPPPDQLPSGPAITTTATSMATRRMLFDHATQMTQSAAPSRDYSALADFIPYQADLRRFYNEHRADSRWHGGYAVTFALTDHHRIVTLNIWRLKLAFPGHPHTAP